MTAILLILFFGLIAALALWSVSNIIAVLGGSPPVHTPTQTCHAILSAIPLKSRHTIVDLGSGTGNILACAARKFQATAIGYEISPFPYFISWCRSLTTKKMRVHYASIYEANLRRANVIFIYLLPKLITKLFDKIKKEAKPGAKIITRGFPLPEWQPIKKITVGRERTRIFIYQVK